ncbi:hypothetical protein CWT12_12925 [Actinomyces sp. 432]|nr:hypothetical protein CWT12_12925 [Actinomyces sp. 432]
MAWSPWVHERPQRLRRHPIASCSAVALPVLALLLGPLALAGGCRGSSSFLFAFFSARSPGSFPLSALCLLLFLGCLPLGFHPTSLRGFILGCLGLLRFVVGVWLQQNRSRWCRLRRLGLGLLWERLWQQGLGLKQGRLRWRRPGCGELSGLSDCALGGPSVRSSGSEEQEHRDHDWWDHEDQGADYGVSGAIVGGGHGADDPDDPEACEERGQDAEDAQCDPPAGGLHVCLFLEG